MQLGTNLFKARKKSGLSQEEVAAKLGVSRQTISKWELDETLPDIRQAKKLAGLYHLTLDELIDFDTDLEEIQQAIHSISEEKQKKVDWTAVWGKRSPPTGRRWTRHPMPPVSTSCWRISRPGTATTIWTPCWS